eukprot:GHUV01044797.1.p1 GENE.GHUV01044797.1~~GHUV01044797.1.p1  ORF type:complete len:113 (+),score=14.74 GHUV01044797.1:623-961(+)
MVGREGPGIHEAVTKSINKCDQDLWRDLYGSIVLSGGCNMLPGLADRMSKEVTVLAPTAMKVRVVAPPERKCLAWIGGSIMGSLCTPWGGFGICKAEYAEVGAEVVHRRYLG